MSRATPNPLSQGFYTVSEAARLIEAGNTQRIYGWLRGFHGRAAEPLLARDYEPIGGVQELSFLDLMEVRFVEHFREHKVKPNTLRRAAAKLRKEFSTAHPFALRDVIVVADKADVLIREIFQESAEKEKDERFRSLLTDNYVMYEAIKQSLVPGVTFDAATKLANTWTPRPDEFPSIRINPKVAYGRPVTPKGIPTGTLYDAWIAEGKNEDTVAYWYGVPTPDVLEAIRFEQGVFHRGEARAA